MRHKLKAVLIAASSLAIAPAHGQEQRDTIVVTATRISTPVDALPADVVVIDADDALARGEITLDEALAQTPGIQAPRTGPIGQQTSIFSGGFESNHTLVLFDGVRLDDPSTPESVFDAGQDTLGAATRVEVVQGPMSALYGSGALGGVVNIVARRGGEGALNPRLEVAGGSFGTITGIAGVDGTLGRLRYALTGESYASDGYDIVPERIATHTGEPDGAEVTTLTGAFDFDVTDALALNLLVRQRKASADFDPGFFGNIDENPQSVIAQNDASLWRLGATYAFTEALSVRVSSGELKTDRVITDFGIVGDEFHGNRRFADVSAIWDLGDWTLLFGGDRDDEKIDAVSFGSPIVGAQEHWGVYAATQGTLGPVDLTAALRHDDFEGFGGETTWRAGATYRFGERARVYAAYGASYRAPSLYELNVPFFGNPSLDPESAQGLEIGGDWRLALFGQGDGLEFNALYRTSEVDDLIGFLGFSYGNVDRADIDFAEARVAVRPTDWLTARLAYAATDAIDAGTGQELLRRPSDAWSAQLEAAHGPFTAQIAWRQVGSRLDTTYDDLGFFVGTAGVEAYDIVRASASWAVSDAVKLYVAADNLLDETYEPVNGFAGAPASVLVGIRVTP